MFVIRTTMAHSNILKTIDVSQTDKSKILQERVKRLGITVRVKGNICNRSMKYFLIQYKNSHHVLNPHV